MLRIPTGTNPVLLTGNNKVEPLHEAPLVHPLLTERVHLSYCFNGKRCRWIFHNDLG